MRRRGLTFKVRPYVLRTSGACPNSVLDFYHAFTITRLHDERRMDQARPIVRSPAGTKGGGSLTGRQHLRGDRVRAFRRAAAGFVAAVAAAAGLALASGEAAAQSAFCTQIRAQIAQLDRPSGGGGGGRRFAAAANRQRAEIANATRQYQAAGCGGFFQGAQCSALQSRIGQMRANLAQLEAQTGGGGGASAGRSQQRARLMTAYEANCGGGQRQYQAGYETMPERQIYRTPGAGPQTAYRTGPEPQRSGFGNFIEHLFGARREPEPSAPPVAPVPEETLRPRDTTEERPRNVGYRAVCVRLCDGAFFPMTSSARPGASLGQEEMCQMQCPGADVALYRMRDDQIENAVSSSGAPYTALPNALRFRQRFDATCTCRPRSGSWAEAFTHRQDPTLRSGDQVVSAEQARLLSLPASQRQAVREQIQAAERARREAERQAQIDRTRGPDGRSRATIGLDGTVRMPDEPPAIRGSGEPAPETTGTPVPAPPVEDRPVRIIGPAYAPRASGPGEPSGG